jgi:hypothetical protein
LQNAWYKVAYYSSKIDFRSGIFLKVDVSKFPKSKKKKLFSSLVDELKNSNAALFDEGSFST